MLVHKGFKFRLCPTKEQKSLLLQHGGNARFLWNYLWKLNQDTYEKTKKYKFFYDMVMMLPDIKKDKEFFNLSVAQSLQQVCKQLDKAIQFSFKKETIKERKIRISQSVTPKEMGKAFNYGFPKFKSKNNNNDSFTIPQKFKIFKNSIKLPKIGKVRWRKHRKIEGTPKHITITQDGEQWYCSVTCEVNIPDKQYSDKNIVGVDLGLKTFAMFSDGESEKRHRFIKRYQNKLEREQRKLSRKQKGSNNRNKQRIKVQSVHRKIRNSRKDLHHQISSRMIAKYSGFIFEDLNVSGMMGNKKLAKQIADVGWYNFTRILEYKSLWNSKRFLKIDRYEATSKTCCECDWKNENLTLFDRVFDCQECSNKRDRDLNASINIRNLGFSTLGLRESNAFGGNQKISDELGKKIVNSNLLEATGVIS